MPDLLTFMAISSLFFAAMTITVFALKMTNEKQKHKDILDQKDQAIKNGMRIINNYEKEIEELKKGISKESPLLKEPDIVTYAEIETMIGMVSTGQAEEHHLTDLLQRLIPNKPIDGVEPLSAKTVKTVGYLSEHGISRLKERDFTEELVRRSDLEKLEGQLNCDLIVQKLETEKWRQEFEFAPDKAHYDIVVDALAECKAIAEGSTELTLKQVIDNCLAEIEKNSKKKKVDSENILN